MDQHTCLQCGKSGHLTYSDLVTCHDLLNAKYTSSNLFITKDSGKRQEFSTGMQRDIQDDKPRYDLLDLPMLKRWAELMGRGAKKYGENNWRKAATEEELARFKASALRHLFQYLEGDTSEDHGAAVFFNIAGAEMVKAKLTNSNNQFVAPDGSMQSKFAPSIVTQFLPNTFDSQDIRLK